MSGGGSDSASAPQAPRLGVVLSAGGLRGAAHLGVLRRLISARLPIAVIVGSSAGAVVGAFYAAVGSSIEEIIEDTPRLRGRDVVLFSVTRRTSAAVGRRLLPYCGIVPARLEALERARFDALHHGVAGFGVVCHDLGTMRPWYFSTGDTHGAPLAAVVRASAAVPPFFPPRSLWVNGTHLRLTDGGVSDPLPIEFARRPGLGATHLVVSDCRRRATPVRLDDRMVHVRPALPEMGTLRSSRFALVDAVRAGEAAMTDAVLDRLRDWLAR